MGTELMGIVSVIVGALALTYHRKLAEEMSSKFTNVYGRMFKVESFFKSKLLQQYLNIFFILFGVAALFFAAIAFINLFSSF